MDNASKALIMAGAVLIAIAIVGVGVYIFSATSSITDVGNTQMDAATMALANSTIRQYEGDNIRGSQVQELYDYVKVLNAGGAYPEAISFRLNGAVVSGDISITKSAYYKVKVDTSSSGYVNGITVTQ